MHEIERTFADGCERPGFRLVHYSLQGNHAHLVVEAQDQAALGRGMKAIGSRLARAVNRIAKRIGPVLADRYHQRLLPTPKEVRNALRYVLLNARRHAQRADRGVCVGYASTRPRPRVGSTAGSEGALDAGRKDRVARARPVARARTWLLTAGWRRHGLLDPADVPG